MYNSIFVQNIFSKLALKALLLSLNSYSEVLIYLRKSIVFSHLIRMRIAAIDRLLGNNKKALAINTILIANALIWYSFGFKYLIQTLELSEFEKYLLPIVTIHFLGLFLALIIGELLSHKIKNRFTFLLLWMFAGIILSIIPLMASMSVTVTFLGLALFSVIIGVNFGFGIPLCLGYFASTTEAANRGKSGGIIFLLSSVGTALMLLGMGNQSFLIVSFVLAVWRALGFLFLIPIRSSVEPLRSRSIISYRDVLSNRTFLLYFIPWLMINIVNSLSFSINDKFFDVDFVRSSSSIEFVLAGVSAVIFGFFADSKGRKRLAVAGFALMGLGYGVLSFTGTNSDPNLIGWYFYTIVDGITWGSFTTLFVFALWGDIAEGRSSERIYAIAIIPPYLLSSFVRISLGPYFAELVENTGAASIFPLFSFFLFIAVLPLVIAPETLSEQTIKNNDLNSYIDKAQKKVLKVKKKQPEFKDEKNADSESDEQSDDYKRAKELAEKYY